MIKQYRPNDHSITVQSDLAGEFPIYLYLSPDKKFLLYSNSVIELLDDARVVKPLHVSHEGISFLLQSGVVPLPNSAYENLFILGAGHKVQVASRDNQVELEFNQKFPFLNANRLTEGEMQPDEDYILQLLADATISRIDNSQPSFLFHSAGKDSNTIALSLAEAGWNDKITLVTHRASHGGDESEISKSISKRLGFKHMLLEEPKKFTRGQKEAIFSHYINAPFPCVDKVSFAYPFYIEQINALRGANVIDGGGNDIYMCTPPTRLDYFATSILSYSSRYRSLSKVLNSESWLSLAFIAPSQCFRLNGFNYSDSKKIHPNSTDIFSYWIDEYNSRKAWDLFDLKTYFLTQLLAQESHIRKVRNFADANKSNLILPFANASVAEYFAVLPEKYLFSRKYLKNKLILRKILKDRVKIDSDKLGKIGYTFDARTLFLENYDFIYSEITKCKLWDKDRVSDFVKRNDLSLVSNRRKHLVRFKLIFRLFLISAWFNNNKYLNVRSSH